MLFSDIFILSQNLAHIYYYYVHGYELFEQRVKELLPMDRKKKRKKSVGKSTKSKKSKAMENGKEEEQEDEDEAPTQLKYEFVLCIQPSEGFVKTTLCFVFTKPSDG